MRAEPLLILLVAAQSVLAAEPGDLKPRVKPHGYERPSERLFQADADHVNASDAVDELIDELAADVAQLSELTVSPLLIDRITVSPNLNQTFGPILEARLIAALARSSGVKVVRCYECDATRSRVENGQLIVSTGLTQRDDLSRVADAYGAKAVLSAALTYEEEPGRISLDVTMARANDGAVLYAEGYRFESDTSMLYRGADTAQHRADRLQDLEDRINGRPHMNQSVVFGAMTVPFDDGEGPLLGVSGAYRLLEEFGIDRGWRAGLSVGGFIHSSKLAGALLDLMLLRRLTSENLYSPTISAGGMLGGFVTGMGGNTPRVGGTVEVLFGHRLAMQGSLSYIVPFDLAKKGTKVGGLCPQLGAAIQW